MIINEDNTILYLLCVFLKLNFAERNQHSYTAL